MSLNVLYKNTTNNFWHWATELDGYIADVNSLKINPDGRKLNLADYLDGFLLSSGEDEQEFELNLKHFQQEYKYKYPKFEITEQLVKDVTETFQDFAFYFGHELIKSKNTITVSTVRAYIFHYFEVRGWVQE